MFAKLRTIRTVCHDKRFVMGHALTMIVRVLPFRFPELPIATNWSNDNKKPIIEAYICKPSRIY